MSTDWNALIWLNPPPLSEITTDGLRLVTGSETDFWQQTYYGFHRDNGHFLHRSRAGDFTAETRFSGRYETLYDQAGLMIRRDARNWMKCGIEYTDGQCHLSTVVTVDGRSDWSAFALPAPISTLDLKASRLGDALFVQYRTESGQPWHMARLAGFPAEFDLLDVGVMVCSPQRAGFEAVFHHFTLGDPESRDIH